MRCFGIYRSYNCLRLVRVVVGELWHQRRPDHRVEALVRLEQCLRSALDEQLECLVLQAGPANTAALDGGQGGAF